MLILLLYLLPQCHAFFVTSFQQAAIAPSIQCRYINKLKYTVEGDHVSVFNTAQCPTVIIGSGPAGLATALMLAKVGIKGITLYDQLSEPPPAEGDLFWGNYDSDRSYLIGLNGRDEYF